MTHLIGSTPRVHVPIASTIRAFAALAVLATGLAAGAYLPTAAPALHMSAATPAHGLPLAFFAGLTQAQALHTMTAEGSVSFLPGAVHFGLPGASGSALELRFEGARNERVPELGERLPGVIHSYRGADAGAWRERIATFGRVTYRDLYPGVDLTYDGPAGVLKATYVVEPGADPTRIRWRYTDADEVRIDTVTGALRARKADAWLEESAPIAWQTRGEQRQPVELRFEQTADGAIGFAVGAYDRTRPLVIDPAILFGTYVGGNGLDRGRGVAVDGSGNIYVVGNFTSSDFLGQPSGPNGFADVVVLKLTPDGKSVLYAAYIGGGGDDQGLAIAVNGAGEAYVTADPDTDFPIRNAVKPSKPGTGDGILVKLTASGQIAFSTYLGFNTLNFRTGDNVELDASGNAYVVGNSYDPYSGASLIGLTKLNSAGTQVLLDTTFGGLGNEQWGAAVTVDGAGKIYVAGGISGFRTEFPVTPNAIQPLCGPQVHGGSEVSCNDDAILAIFSPSGSVEYATYLGGSGSDGAVGVGVDAAGNIVIAGTTDSNDFHTEQALQPQCPNDAALNACYYSAFVTKLAPGGTSYNYSTYLNSTEKDRKDFITGLAVTSLGEAYISGYSNGASLPVKDAPQPGLQPGVCLTLFEDRLCFDAFVIKLTAAGGLGYGTYLGGSLDELSGGIAVDAAGNAIVTGYTKSAAFPVTSGVVQPQRKSGDDFFVVKLGSTTPTPPPPPEASFRVHIPIVVR